MQRKTAIRLRLYNSEQYGNTHILYVEIKTRRRNEITINNTNNWGIVLEERYSSFSQVFGKNTMENFGK